MVATVPRMGRSQTLGQDCIPVGHGTAAAHRVARRWRPIGRALVWEGRPTPTGGSSADGQRCDLIVNGERGEAPENGARGGFEPPTRGFSVRCSTN